MTKKIITDLKKINSQLTPIQLLFYTLTFSLALPSCILGTLLVDRERHEIAISHCFILITSLECWIVDIGQLFVGHV